MVPPLLSDVRKHSGLRRPFVICFEPAGVAVGSVLSSAVSSLPKFVVCSDRVLHGLRLRDIPVQSRLSLFPHELLKIRE